MNWRSSLSEEQRSAAVALFEHGHGDQTVSTLLGASRWAVRALYRRWRIRGRGALVTQPSKRSYTFELKVALVQRFLAGEPTLRLAEEVGLSSPTLLKTWARIYRREGEAGLRPKPKGRPPKTDAPPG